VLLSRSADATALGVATLARLGTGEAGSVGEALGVAEAEEIVEPSITADEAAERMAAFRSVISATVPVR
jgi:glycerol kinase